jgi:magnesium-transporting ATPase (P-type)
MLGIAGSEAVITGPEIDAMSDEALRGVVNSCNIYARASPGGWRVARGDAG